ncbi:NADH:ubiquinone oxidoreductase [Paramarasmius palmivorus]|uniref:NADH:ubiquinone reductase (non-electrogenic) n=1 Tax=Paramarasmius palmivorus TaxID=297713 RepID=A0AAW0EDQ1_9AGAR
MDAVDDVDMVTNYSDRDSDDVERVDPLVHGRQLYAQVWKEFYSWKTQSCCSMLDSLRATDTTASIPDTFNYCGRRDQHPTGSPKELCVILTFGADGIPNEEVTHLQEVTVNFGHLPSIPEYTSCTPLSRNYSRELDSSDDPERAPFLPFADDPEFILSEYLESFVCGVQWQKKQAPVDLDDPDLEMIDAEAARRLVFQPTDQPEFSSVDQMHLFFARDRFNFEGEEADFLNLRQMNKSGLIWLSKQRDQLIWPRIPDEELEDFDSTYVPEDSTLFEDINRGTAQFCEHINCITHFCTVHGYERPPLTPSRPYKTNDEMQLAEGHPCGPLCFRNLLATGQSLENFYFDPETTSVISSVLDLTPDIKPCYLSVICRLPCREVFAYRVQKYSDPAVFQYIDDDDVPEPRLISANTEKWTPRTAPCEDSILLEYKECCNVGLQRPKFALVEIKHSKFGWGAFARQHIRHRQFIGEYCGEVIDCGGAFKNLPIEKYLEKNYNFDMPETGCPQRDSGNEDNPESDSEDKSGQIINGQIINAHIAGNETRYLNHAKDEGCNCEALGLVVNGEPRLGIIAMGKIKRGQELFLDYGKGYWINQLVARSILRSRPPVTSALSRTRLLNRSFTTSKARLNEEAGSSAKEAPAAPRPSRWRQFTHILGRATLITIVAGGATFVYVTQRERHPGAQLPYDPEKKTIVVLGSGWGATSLLKTIDNTEYNVVVISPKNYFLFTPLLPSVAVGTLSPRSILQPTRYLTRHKPREVTVIEAEAKSVDPIKKTVTFEDDSEIKGKISQTTIPYDYLVYAVGAEVQTFGIPGVQEKACFMKELADAEEMQRRFKDCIETAAFPGQQEQEIDRLLHIFVVGGGPTGVEVSGEIHDFLEDDLKSWYPELAGRVRISLVEALPSVLPMFSKQLIDYTESTFKESKIDILTKTMVKEVKDNAVVLQMPDKSIQEVPCGMVVWAGGNKGRKITQDLMAQFPSVQTNRRGITVDESNLTSNADHLRMAGADGIFAIGDCTSTSYAPTAQVASQQGAYLARVFAQLAKKDNLEAKLIKLQQEATTAADPERKAEISQALETAEKQMSKVKLRPFHYSHQGSLAYVLSKVDEDLGPNFDDRYIGSDKAIADLPFANGNIATGGVATFLFWRSAYLSTLFSLRNRVLVANDWIITKIFGRDLSRD